MGILLAELESKMVVLVLELMCCGLQTRRRHKCHNVHSVFDKPKWVSLTLRLKASATINGQTDFSRTR